MYAALELIQNIKLVSFVGMRQGCEREGAISVIWPFLVLPGVLL